MDENPYKSPETEVAQRRRRFALQVAQVVFIGLTIVGLLLPIASLISAIASLTSIAPPLPWTFTYTVTGRKLATLLITGVLCFAIGYFGLGRMRR